MTARRDASLVGRLQEAVGEERALPPGLRHEADRLFQQELSRIYALCYHLVGDAELASELAQDTLLTAWRKLPQFRGDCAFATWLYAIARFHCFNALRRTGDLLTSDGVVQAVSPEGSVLSRMRRRERLALLRAAAADLDPMEQEAVYLRYVEQLPIDRITALMEVEGASGARGLLQRCRRKLGRDLRRRLTELGHGTSFFGDSG